jgi:mannose-6-phosphate isomerase-like protein (cupin superfamily)
MTTALPDGYVPRQAANAVWFLGNLLSMRAGPDDGFTLIEGQMSAGHAPPLHMHEGDHEAFYVLAGEVRFRCGDAEFDAGPGDAVRVAPGTPHAFRVGDDGARMLMFSTSSHLAAFMTEGGEPAQALTLPPADRDRDMERVTRLAAKHDMTILGPPLQQGPIRHLP